MVAEWGLTVVSARLASLRPGGRNLRAALTGGKAAAVRWRRPAGRLRARLVRDAVIVTGLDATTVPFVAELARAGRPGSVVVIEPDAGHPLLGAIRATGARVVIGQPALPQVLLPVIAGNRGCALRHLYALAEDVTENEAVLAAARTALGRYPGGPQQPHLVARIDDPRHAGHWRGAHIGVWTPWLEDALSAPESTASTLADELCRSGAGQVLLCGDGTLALAVLRELARRAWEREELARAAAAGGAALPGAEPVQTVLLLDRRAGDLRREYLATSPPSFARALPSVEAVPGPWQDTLLHVLDAAAPAAAAHAAVVVADAPGEDSMHGAGRAARLHPGIPVFVLTSGGAGRPAPVFDRLQPYRRGLLADGKVPGDSWTRMARHWHECYRLRNAPAGQPWAELDDTARQDNVQRLRSVMAAVAARGRRWVPSCAVPPGSFIELNDRDLAEAAGAGHGDAEYLRAQLAYLEDAGFMPVVPAGGPPGAAEFQRVGTVLARKLRGRRRWTRPAGGELAGEPGDWRVLDDDGDERTVRDAAFRASHEPLDGERWRRTGTCRAWRVDEERVLRTLEGTAVARPGDWVVEGRAGERWPVTDAQFRRTYQAVTGE
jgi:hypothetical protein